MVIVPAVLLLLAAGLSFVPGGLAWARRAAGLMADHRAYAAWVLHGAHVPLPVDVTSTTPLRTSAPSSGIGGL